MNGRSCRQRLLVMARAFGPPSEVWILRQLAGFRRFETSALFWSDEAEHTIHPPVTTRILGSDFWAPERSMLRWTRRIANLPREPPWHAWR
jgi:hypothetical protein